MLGFVASLLLVSPVRHARDQEVLWSQLRSDLANAVAPVGGPGLDGTLASPGTPIALLEIPSIGVREVVAEGTTSTTLMSGPGHRRDTVFPGQAGTSVIFGRQSAYGGPFGRVRELLPGDVVTVTTGQGIGTYKVTDVRRGGEPLPPALTSGQGRLTLVTADGSPYIPDQVLRVDASLTSVAQPTPARVIGAAAMEPAEAPMAGDSTAWIPLVLWGQLLLIVTLVFTWAVLRWGRWQAWIVGVPVIAFLGLAVADQVVALLPNLM